MICKGNEHKKKIVRRFIFELLFNISNNYLKSLNQSETV